MFITLCNAWKVISNISLQSVDGSFIEIVGSTHLTFKLGNQIFTQKFIICKNISQSIILGRDFLTKHNVIIRFDTCCIELHGESIPLEDHDYITSLVKLTKDVVLKPRSTMTCFVKARHAMCC